MEWAFDLSVLADWGVDQIEVSGYDMDPIPLIEGVEVVVHPTCAVRFNAAVDDVTLAQLAATMSEKAIQATR